MDVQTVAGKWVADDQMHPAMNIASRDWMTKDGEMHGTFRCYGDIPDEARRRGLLWHFPAKTPPMAGSE